MERFYLSVLRDHASRLYHVAGRVAYVYATVGAVLGYLVGFSLNPYLTGDLNRAEQIFVGVLGAVGGAVLAWQLGAAKAESLRMQAQSALCQAQILENMRSALGEGAGSHGAAAR